MIEQILIALPLVIGAYITISLLKLPDFSLESAYLFGAVAAYLALDLPLPLIILISMCGGMLVGALVSFFNQILNIPYLLAAIVVNGLFHGLSQFCLGTSMASFPVDAPLFLVPVAVVLLIAPLLRSQLGYSFAIYGNNPRFFASHALSGRFVLFSGVMLGHACAGLSGFLFAASNGFVDVTMNFGVILLCLTAMMIGKFCITNRRPQILIPILGTILFFAIQHALLRLGINLKYFNAFQALFILIILYAGHRKKNITLDHLGV